MVPCNRSLHSVGHRSAWAGGTTIVEPCARRRLNLIAGAVGVPTVPSDLWCSPVRCGRGAVKRGGGCAGDGRDGILKCWAFLSRRVRSEEGHKGHGGVCRLIVLHLPKEGRCIRPGAPMRKWSRGRGVAR